MLEVVVTEDYEHMSKVAFDILISQVARHQQEVPFNLGLSTGNTPIGLYKLMQSEQEKFAKNRKFRTFNLDEWVRRSHAEGDNPDYSYSSFMDRNLISGLGDKVIEKNIPGGMRIVETELDMSLNEYPDIKFSGTGEAKSIRIHHTAALACPYLNRINGILREYTQALSKAGLINSWVVGIGEEGHIAFHESGIPFESDVMLVRVAHSTRRNADKAYFHSAEEAPRYALRVGASGIDKYADNVILLASGKRKAKPVASSILEDITDEVPASILKGRVGHSTKHAIYVIDRAAAEILMQDGKGLLNTSNISFTFAA